jgi:hypothetical protein
VEGDAGERSVHTTNERKKSHATAEALLEGLFYGSLIACDLETRAA